MTQPNDPAGVISAELLDRCGEVNFSPFGLTKREKFAAMAMQGILADPSMADTPTKEILAKIGVPESMTYQYPKHYAKYISLISVEMADALIEALNNEPKTEPNA